MKQLAPYPLIRPGFKGLNKAKAADTTLGGAWALELQNAVFDDSGRVAARRGWAAQTPLHTHAIVEPDPYWNDVVLLMHANAVGSTTYVDSSSYNHTMSYTAGSPALAQSATQLKWGASSAYYPLSTSGIMKTAIASEFQFAAQDFTVEAWIYLPAAWTPANGFVPIFKLGDGGYGTVPFFLNINNNSGTAQLRVWGKDNTGTVDSPGSGPIAITTGAWHHIAASRHGTSLRLFVDGVQSAQTQTWGTVATATGYVYTGVDETTSSRQAVYIDDLRVTVGVSRYNADFDVPTAEFPESTDGVFVVPRQMHELVRTNGTVDLITAASNPQDPASNFLFHGITVPADITGTLTPTGCNWQFVNFRGWVLGWQKDHNPIIWTGSGAFKEIVETSGTAPAGDAACAAFGRIWAVDSDRQTIKYCALLDPYDWGGSDTGTIDMRTVWTHGTDVVVGICAFGASLVVFGQRHIIFWTDGQGSELGLDPTQMYVADTIEGTGLQARDSIQNIGSGDVLYLSPTGLQSLARVIVNKNNPLATIDRPVQQYLRGLWKGEDPAAIRSVYNANEAFYLLILPRSGTTFCFDTREPLEDGNLRSAEWPEFGAYCGAHLRSGNMLFGFSRDIGKYAGYLDDGSTYDFLYKSPWLTLADMNPQFEFAKKIPKRLHGLLFNDADQDFTYTWAYDFDPSTAGSVAVSATGGRFAEYNQAEYGTNGVYDVDDPAAVAGTDVAEYGGQFDVVLSSEETSGDGRWVQIGCTATINDSFLALQQLDLYAKVGSMT